MQTLDAIIDGWARLGAGYIGQHSDETPDVERLILQTSVLGVDDPRTVTLAVTWLSRYGSLVAEHRLSKLLRDGVVDEAATCRLGFILDAALVSTHLHDRRRNLERPMQLCRPAARPAPYFTMDAGNGALRARAERRASEVSKRWNLWAEPLSLKYDALRPASWVIEHNPDLAFRADFRGDLRTTLLIALRTNAEAGASVSELSRWCGASRTAVVSALKDLVLANRVICEREGRSSRVRAAA